MARARPAALGDGEQVGSAVTLLVLTTATLPCDASSDDGALGGMSNVPTATLSTTNRK
jgi:hypothetical protein